jgi:hypothetical protein
MPIYTFFPERTVIAAVWPAGSGGHGLHECGVCSQPASCSLGVM